MEVLCARSLLLRLTELALPPLELPTVAAPTPPDMLATLMFRSFAIRSAITRRWSWPCRSGFGHARSIAWMRMRYPLVLGEEPSPWVRVMVVAADSGNGITNALDVVAFSFMNLGVYLHRLPAGQWVCLNAYVQPESSGVGLAQSRLWDTTGPLGHTVQALLMTPQGAGAKA